MSVTKVKHLLESFDKEFFKKDEKKTEMITLRTTPKVKQWLDKNDLNASKIFNTFAMMLMEEGK